MYKSKTTRQNSKNKTAAHKQVNNMATLLMQTKLGQHHNTVKEFGQRGTPIRHAFYHKVHTNRVKSHLLFLAQEKYPKVDFSSDEGIEALNAEFKRFKRQLLRRSYQVL